MEIKNRKLFQGLLFLLIIIFVASISAFTTKAVIEKQYVNSPDAKNAKILNEINVAENSTQDNALGTTKAPISVTPSISVNPVAHKPCKRTLNFADIQLTMSCNWYLNNVRTNIKEYIKPDKNNSIYDTYELDVMPVFELTDGQNILTFKNFIPFFFPEGVGLTGVFPRLENPTIIYKPTDSKGYYLVRVQDKSNKHIFNYYLTQYFKQPKPGFYTINNRFNQIILNIPDLGDLKTIDKLVKTICIDKKSYLCTGKFNYSRIVRK